MRDAIYGQDQPQQNQDDSEDENDIVDLRRIHKTHTEPTRFHHNSTGNSLI